MTAFARRVVTRLSFKRRRKDKHDTGNVKRDIARSIQPRRERNLHGKTDYLREPRGSRGTPISFAFGDHWVDVAVVCQSQRRTIRDDISSTTAKTKPLVDVPTRHVCTVRFGIIENSPGTVRLSIPSGVQYFEKRNEHSLVFLICQMLYFVVKTINKLIN